MPRTSFAAILCLIAGLAACDSGPNPTDNITRALKAANFNEVTVTWESALIETL